MDKNFEDMRKQSAMRLTGDFLRHIEQHGLRLRERVGLRYEGKLDPLELAKSFEIDVKFTGALGLDEETLNRLKMLGAGSKGFSGGVHSTPDGGYFMLINSDQTPERVSATIMEEICHVYFQHQASELHYQPDGLYKRKYNPQIEREAYWTGSAALLPHLVIAKAVWERKLIGSLAAEYGVSTNLVEMRIKTLGFWSDYKKNLEGQQ